MEIFFILVAFSPIGSALINGAGSVEGSIQAVIMLQ